VTPPRVPNFIIGGAPNAGTTSLYYYLRQHPRVYMCPVKEPSFFGAAAFLAAHRGRGAPRTSRTRSGRATTWDEYVQLFRGARDAPAVGEATPRYLVLPGAASEIRSRLPEARIIFVLRDPAERLFNRYLRRFWPDTHGTFRSRFQAALDPADAWAPALTAGRYATHLKRFFDAFPRDQLQIHLYEDLAHDAAAVVRRILMFLGVDPAHPIDVAQRHNPTLMPRFPTLHRIRRRIFGDRVITHWLPVPALRRALTHLYRRRRPGVTQDPADRALAVEYYREEIARTAALIGRDLSAWLR
jgi:hypothetical protein